MYVLAIVMTSVQMRERDAYVVHIVLFKYIGM